MQAEFKKHMTPKNMMWMVGTIIYVGCFILMIFAPAIAESAVLAFGLGFPLLVTVVVFIYVPSDKLKTSLYAFAICEAVVLALVVTGYGKKIIDVFISLAGIIQCVASIVIIGVPVYGLYRFAKRKGWTQQAEAAADSSVKSFFDQFKEHTPPE